MRHRGPIFSVVQERVGFCCFCMFATQADTLTIILSEAPVMESGGDKPGVILDCDADENVVSLEILDASRRVVQPTQMVYELAGHTA